jgi:hypothetical protein
MPAALIVRVAGLGALLPAVIAGVAFALSWRAWRRGDAPARAGWGGAVGVAAGYLAAHAAIVGRPPLPPIETTHWLFLFVAIAGALGVIESFWSAPAFVRWIPRVALAAALVGLTLRTKMKYSWSGGEAAIWLAAAGVVVLLVWISIDAAGERERGVALPVALMTWAAAMGAILAASGNASYGQLAGAWGATMGGAWVVAILQPNLSLARGATTVAATLAAGLWLNGFFYTEMPRWVGGSLLAPAAAIWALRFGPISRMAGWARAIVVAAIVLVVLSPALTASVRDAIASMESDTIY